MSGVGTAFGGLAWELGRRVDSWDRGLVAFYMRFRASRWALWFFLFLRPAMSEGMGRRRGWIGPGRSGYALQGEAAAAASKTGSGEAWE